jgi:hypothetical protein
MSAVQPNWSKLSGALKQDMIGSPGDAHAEELAPAPPSIPKRANRLKSEFKTGRWMRSAGPVG